jgi:iron(III) transport system ATP-binding protein
VDGPAAGGEPVVELREVGKAYGGVVAVRSLTLSVRRGAIVALLGPSGCGKSTTLRLIAGLEDPDNGEIRLAGRTVAGAGRPVPPEARQLGMVFQDYALFPHLTVEANIAFPLDRLPRGERRARVAELLDLAGLAGYGGRYPHELSGGQQQRVALARALAPRPAIVLLDEPFSNLDATMRKEMREELRDVLQAAGAAALLVTHDQEEAFSLADRIAVMDRGTLLQVDSPRQLYRRPASRAVAALVGEANFLPGEARGADAGCALGSVPLVEPTHGAVELLIRPEALAVLPDPAGPARVRAVTYTGASQSVRLSLPDGTSLRARTGPDLALAPDMAVRVAVTGPVIAYQGGV